MKQWYIGWNEPVYSQTGSIVGLKNRRIIITAKTMIDAEKQYYANHNILLSCIWDII
jgi:hypothetical protein